MTTISEAIEIGLVHHQAGRLEQAEQVYRQVLHANPQHAGAMHLLGLIAIQVGQFGVAAEHIARHSSQRPSSGFSCQSGRGLPRTRPIGRRQDVLRAGTAYRT